MDALDDEEFEGNIIYLLKAAMDFVKRNSKKMWKKGPMYRVEYPEYPERAVQEGIVNIDNAFNKNILKSSPDKCSTTMREHFP